MRDCNGQLPGRFWAKVSVGSGCWLWTAYTDADGYGRFRWNRKKVYAHRLAYEMLVADIPDRLVSDHLCRTPACVNPMHIEPVTSAENIRRGVGPSAKNAVKTHCPRGHAYNEANTYHWRGQRHCRPCNRMHVAAHRAE